jgi:hypothetical protein
MLCRDSNIQMVGIKIIKPMTAAGTERTARVYRNIAFSELCKSELIHLICLNYL